MTTTQPITEVVKEIKEEKMKDKKIVAKIYKKDGKLFFEYKIDPRIEEVYKNLPGEIRTSSSWEGLSFYYIPSILGSDNYRRKLNDFGIVDDFGSGFLKEGRINIAWLRTVGGEGKIDISKYDVGYGRHVDIVRNALAFIKDFFEDYFSNYEIMGDLIIKDVI